MVKNSRIIYLIFSFPFLVLLFFLRTPKQNREKDILELTRKNISWIVTRKGKDTEVHNYRTVWYQPTDKNEKDNINLFRISHPMYDSLYYYIEVGDTLIKPQGSTDFLVKNIFKRKIIPIVTKQN